MRKKVIIGGMLAATVLTSAVLGGCSQVSTNQTADMNQVIAEVNVSNAKALEDDLKYFADALGTTEVIKRELVTYFINVGSTYMNNYGYDHEKTFNLLMDNIVDNAVLVQYATLYLLQDKAEKSSKETVLAEYNAKTTLAAKYEYLLDKEDINLAEYSLRYSINSAIDSYEQKILKPDNSSAGTETRTTPGGVDTQKEDYYPKDEQGNLNYNIYTGYEGYLIGQSGAYQDDKLEGTSRTTRIQAYNEFLGSLNRINYNLVDKKTENLRDARNLTYIQDEYASQLENRILNKYYDMFEDEQEEKLVSMGQSRYSIIQSVYDDLYDAQSDSYATESGLSSALSGLSDSQFILYAPDTAEEGTYGYVYNILLPFSASQSARLTELQSKYKDDKLDGGYKPEYYIQRNKLLSEIYTTDQRAAWFNGSTDYAYKTEKGAFSKDGKGWLFFENNNKYTDRYEPISKYFGKYAYKGTVVENKDDYVLIPDRLDIDDMLTEFKSYVNFASGATVSGEAKTDYGNALLQDTENLYKDDGSKKIDYENFIYASGKVDLAKFGDEQYNRSNLLYSESENYKALSAVNELQYAYTTDTGVLSQFVGYSVEAGDTRYIKEFEYAAHKAINQGAGSWVVCAGDYGWHLIYVTYTVSNTGHKQYAPNWAENVEKEGTFENLFYEMVKTKNISNISTTRRTQIITSIKSDDTVSKMQDRYQDLLDMDKE